MSAITYIQSDNELRDIVDKLQFPRIALDTEFVRKDTYYPQLSLIQLAVAGRVFLIDIPKISDFHPITKLLTNPHIEKIIHSPRQDNEVLKVACGEEPSLIFDTQLAAAFLGYEMQISYKKLIQEKIGIHLDKAHTYSDWLRRPLSDEQIQYAAEDVLYLEQARDMLASELQENNKSQWFQEESIEREKEHYDYCVQFINKTAHKTAAQVAALKCLTEWREKQAQKINLPRQWVMTDRCIQKIALLYKTSDKMAQQYLSQQIPQIQECREVMKSIPHILEMLKSIEYSESDLPEPLPRFDSTMQRKLVRLQNELNQIAQNHAIAANLIANKKQLITIIQSCGAQNPFTGWRAEIMQEPLSRISPAAP